MARTLRSASLSDPIFGLTSDHLAVPVELGDGHEALEKDHPGLPWSGSCDSYLKI